MAAYVVGTIRVTDPAYWEQYVARVAETFGPHGGRVLFRGNRPEPFSGAAHGERIVVIEFPDLEAARRWHRCPTYQSLITLRDAGADVVLTAYQS